METWMWVGATFIVTALVVNFAIIVNDLYTQYKYSVDPVIRVTAVIFINVLLQPYFIYVEIEEYFDQRRSEKRLSSKDGQN